MAMNPKDLLVWIKSLARGQALPLDASEVHESFKDAQEYANTAIAYGGQTVKVKLDDGKYHEYILQPSENGYTLEEIRSGDSAGIHVGDESSMPEGTVVHIDPEGEGYEMIELDATLSKSGYAADANVTGKKIDELFEDIANHGVWYGVTKTADYVNPKIVTTTTGDFKLAAGARIGVKFIYGNTGAQSINVDGTGDVLMVASNNEDGTYSTDTPVTYKPVGQILWMTYDGEYFVIDDTVRATEDTVGKVTISDSVTKTSSTTAASSTAVKAAYDKAVAASKAIDNLQGGMNATAKTLLITILRNGVYTSDQSANITALETALNESGGDDTDTGGVTQTGSVLYITGGVTATQNGTTLKVA